MLLVFAMITILWVNGTSCPLIFVVHLKGGRESVCGYNGMKGERKSENERGEKKIENERERKRERDRRDRREIGEIGDR